MCRLLLWQTDTTRRKNVIPQPVHEMMAAAGFFERDVTSNKNLITGIIIFSGTSGAIQFETETIFLRCIYITCVFSDPAQFASLHGAEA
jgi:hypothetical protein